MAGMTDTHVPDTLAEFRDEFLELPESERRHWVRLIQRFIVTGSTTTA